jgi:DHA2 family multidrug resistance protein
LLIILAVMSAALLQTLDATIVNVALPTIEGNVGASIDEGTWIITGYIIANVVVIPLVPFMLARFGRRQYFATSIIGFTLASFLCGTAHSLVALVVFRILQGALGGGLIATSAIILRDTLPPEKIGTSSALFAIALTVGPALGPTLGGILTDNLSWPWVFDINLVPGTLAAVLILTMLKNPTPPSRMRLDLIGVAFLVAGLGAMQYVLDEGNRNDWLSDQTILALTITSVLGIACFVFWELRGTASPVVDLRIFRFRNIRVGFPTGILLGMVVFGPIIMIPQYVQGILGFTATMSGLLVLMRALPVLLLTPLVARLATRVDVRYLLGGGFVISALSYGAIAFHMTPQSAFGTFAFLLALSGVGQSFLIVPLLVGILSSLPPREAPKANALISLSIQLGGSIVSTLLITVFDRRTYFHSDIYRGAITLANPSVHQVLRHSGSLARISQLLALQASNAGFADAIFLLAAISVAPVLLVLLLVRPGKHAPTPALTAE